jgi:uncharacterized protein (DUF433 family)
MRAVLDTNILVKANPRPPGTPRSASGQWRVASGTIRTMNWRDRISVNPEVRSGKPCIRGTRITVYDVLEYLAGGMTDDDLLADFPDLTRDDIRACLAFAAARERRLSSSVA